MTSDIPVPLSSCERGIPPRLNLFLLSRFPSSFRFFAARNSVSFQNAMCDKEFQNNICYIIRGVS